MTLFLVCTIIKLSFSVHISNAALASNTSQSSVFEHDAELAMDGRLETCSMTQVDNKTWSVDLKPNVRIKGVTITNNKFINLNQHFKVILEGKLLKHLQVQNEAKTSKNTLHW